MNVMKTLSLTLLLVSVSISVFAQEAQDPINSKLRISLVSDSQIDCKLSIKEIKAYTGEARARYMCSSIPKTQFDELSLQDLGRFAQKKSLKFEYEGNSVRSLLQLFSEYKNWLLTIETKNYYADRSAELVAETKPFEVQFISRQDKIVTLQVVNVDTKAAAQFTVEMQAQVRKPNSKQ